MIATKRAFAMPVAVLVTAALLTGGAADPGQPPDDVLTAVEDATASAGAVPTLVRVPANKSMRSVVQSQSWAKQHEMGIALLRFCGISV